MSRESAVEPPNPWSDRIFGLAFALSCVASLVPLWLVQYPPMVDLSQHAAQVATWHRWGGTDFDYSQYYWINWATPYVVANALSYILSFVVPVLTAFKLVISIALVGLPCVTLALLRETGGNRWWALATLPLGYSFSFFMGFVAFALATPLALLVLLVSWRYAEDPTRRRGWVLFGLLQVLFFTHVLAFGWAGLTAALLTALRSPGWRATLLNWVPLLAAAVLPLTWVVVTFQIDTSTHTGAYWGAFTWERLPMLPSLVVGFPLDARPWIAGCLLLAVPLVTGGRPSRDIARWLPLGISVVLYLFAPGGLFGTAYLYSRFVVFVLPALLFALDWRADLRTPRRARRGGLLIAAVSLAWLVHLGNLFRLYDAEVGSLGKLLEGAPEHGHLLYLALERDSELIPYPVYLHSGLWYQVERGGLVDYSFAEMFPNRYRYLPDQTPNLPMSIEWRPRHFDWHRDGGERYDLVLLRGASDTPEFVHSLRAPLAPLARAAGGWWLWTRADSPQRSPSRLGHSPPARSPDTTDPG
ncbi:MAG: hypothetical protein MPN21_17435 [Thermoanaerobaculia bacterium]|nr:hypothetical protein [Thermoanaerobaculia bacterium]